MTTNKKYYVTMTDKFLSGWGLADNRISKFVIECDTMAQANMVYNNAIHMNGFKHVNIAYNKPNYPNSRYHTSIKHCTECPIFY